MSQFSPSGLPVARAERVTHAARSALREHLPLVAEAFAFAGVLTPIGNGDTDLIIAVDRDDAGDLAGLAYSLLLRACATAHDAGDDAFANACAEAIEVLDAVADAPGPVQ